MPRFVATRIRLSRLNVNILLRFRRSVQTKRVVLLPLLQTQQIVAKLNTKEAFLCRT
nr:MAG TPA: hypothetical protein [Caudoviricetes sp.]